ncbi:BolA/IbaG family iron-sulfur metabolism protein [Buchnera aphidicola]|uniref:BolA/IbaG family iron-sulfur metabolism protein n=1 Tax=Buchnera aphidicola TaxID=9 RepID=UPI0030EC1BFA
MKKKIKSLLIKKLNLQKCIVKNKSNHFKIIAIGKIFNGMNLMNKQKIVYSVIMKYIIKKKIHSVIIDAYSKKNKIE